MSTTAVDADAAPPYGSAPVAPDPSKKLGLVAMVLGLGVFAGSILASVLMGFAAAQFAVLGPNGFNVYLRLDSPDPVESTLAVLAFVHMLLGTGLGLWAITQGIVAIATRRGRAFGVIAIIAALLAPGISLVVYMGTALMNAAS
jgi:hypothetical protein